MVLQQSCGSFVLLIMRSGHCELRHANLDFSRRLFLSHIHTFWPRVRVPNYDVLLQDVSIIFKSDVFEADLGFWD